MPPLQVHSDIVPIGEFKTHAARLMRQVQQTRRPVVITQHGRAAGVLLSAEEFDRLTERQRFVAAVHEGLADAEAGRLVSDEDLAAELERVTATGKP